MGVCFENCVTSFIDDPKRNYQNVEIITWQCMILVSTVDILSTREAIPSHLTNLRYRRHAKLDRRRRWFDPSSKTSKSFLCWPFSTYCYCYCYNFSTVFRNHRNFDYFLDIFDQLFLLPLLFTVFTRQTGPLKLIDTFGKNKFEIIQVIQFYFSKFKIFYDTLL